MSHKIKAKINDSIGEFTPKKYRNKSKLSVPYLFYIRKGKIY